jgi:uncharacterized repeat protein (TIGR01451 family)
MSRTALHRANARRSGMRPQLERLEDRIAPAVIFSENFDGVTAPALPTGWISTGFGSTWSTQTGGFGSPAPSAPNFAFASEPGSFSEQDLTSPHVTITGVNPQISFQLDYNLEKTFDGGQLLISVNGALFRDIVAAGGSFSTGGYTGTINSATGSPIFGQAAWTGDSGGYTLVTAKLPSSVTSGSTVRFEWRVGTDSTIGGPGMAIDDVQVTASQIDLSITNSDGLTSVMPGQNVIYTIVVSNVGSEDANNATVADFFPATLTGVTFTSINSGGATGNTFAGTGNINDTVFLPIGSTITYTASATVAAGAVGVLNDIATVTPAGDLANDLHPANNTATVRNPIPDANHAFVQTLYKDFLGRSGSAAELDAWVNNLPALGQLGVAKGVSHSPEGLTYAVDGYYVKFLGRVAGGGEELGWVNALEHGATEEMVIAGILNSLEFAGRANAMIGAGDINANFVQAAYKLLLNRSGSAPEVNGWLFALPSFGRAGVAPMFLGSQEFRGDFVTQQYGNVLLDRPTGPSAAEVAGWGNSSLDMATIQTAMAASMEYFQDG